MRCGSCSAVAATVIRACARHDEVDNEEVWLSDEMIAIYMELHHRGFAHSVEIWDGENLVGGLYGVSLKAAFFGESMFSRASSVSQIALVALVERLRERGYLLLDAQMRTQHISHFGAIDLMHHEYIGLLAEAKGQLQAAEAHYRAALAVARELGDNRSQGQVLGYLGLLKARRRLFDAARTDLAAGQALLESLGDRQSL